jgi:phosphoribosylcarboxyaminoimidazole (NCAIR) mutase
VQILAGRDARVAKALAEFRKSQTDRVLALKLPGQKA